MRRVIAKWLCPEVFRTEQKYNRLIRTAGDAYWWLGEFPEAAATLRWLLDSHQDESREIGDPGRNIWGSDINVFREKLRNGMHLHAAKSGIWSRIDKARGQEGGDDAR